MILILDTLERMYEDLLHIYTCIYTYFLNIYSEKEHEK